MIDMQDKISWYVIFLDTYTYQLNPLLCSFTVHRFQFRYKYHWNQIDKYFKLYEYFVFLSECTGKFSCRTFSSIFYFFPERWNLVVASLKCSKNIIYITNTLILRQVTITFGSTADLYVCSTIKSIEFHVINWIGLRSNLSLRNIHVIVLIRRGVETF